MHYIYFIYPLYIYVHVNMYRGMAVKHNAMETKNKKIYHPYNTNIRIGVLRIEWFLSNLFRLELQINDTVINISVE